MAKHLIMTLLGVSLTGVAFAALPFSDDFGSGGPSTDWTTDGAFGGNGTLESVQGASETDWRSVTVGVPTDNADGYIGKLSYAATTYSTCWRLAGEVTDTDYVIEGDVFVPVVSTTAEPDDFLYQGFVFYSNSGGYGRVHFQWNTDAGAIAAPRMRVQTTTGGFDTPAIYTDPTDFSAVEGWHKLKVALVGADFEVSLDGTVLGTGTLAAAHAAEGQYGIFQFVDGDTGGTARSVYVDNYSVTPPPAPTAADSLIWTAYE